MKPLLLKLLIEVRDQVSTIEPHSDNEMDIFAHHNALNLIKYLIKHAEGTADLRRIDKLYYENKLDLSTARSLEEIVGEE